MICTCFRWNSRAFQVTLYFNELPSHEAFGQQRFYWTFALGGTPNASLFRFFACCDHHRPENSRLRVVQLTGERSLLTGVKPGWQGLLGNGVLVRGGIGVAIMIDSHRDQSDLVKATANPENGSRVKLRKLSLRVVTANGTNSTNWGEDVL